MRQIAIVFLLAFLVATPFGEGAAAPAQGERILLYDVAAVFDPSGAMEVTETIRVNAQGRQIRRGIYRSIPARWKRGDGVVFTLAVSEPHILRDGVPEPFSEKRMAEETQWRIGDASSSLEPGIYEYTILYTVRNHFVRMPDWDELYWNVTGNGWKLPIDKAHFRLFFRESKDSVRQPMPMRSLDVYTGKKGEKKTHAKRMEGGGVETVSPLRRGEGLTVAWTWPRSLLANAPDPVGVNPVHAFWAPDKNVLWVWIFPALAAVYFGVLWYRLRPGPMPAVIPLFRVPENLSAGMLRYVVKGRYDSMAFAADLLTLVYKKAVTLDESGRTPVVANNSDDAGDLPGVTAEEAKAHEALFAYADAVSLSRAGRGPLLAAKNIFAAAAAAHKKVFLSTAVYSVFGIFLLLSLPLAATFVARSEAIWIFSGIVFLELLMCWVFVFAFRHALSDAGGIMERVLKIAHGLIIAAILSVFFMQFSSLIVKLPLVWEYPNGYGGALVTLCVVWFAGAKLLPRRTGEGVRLLALAKGLAMYLGVAERSRFAALYPPDETVEHFEKLLPYALALDKCKNWATRFESFLAKSGLHDETQAHMRTNTIWRTTNAVRRGVSRAVAPVSSSSSRSGSRSGSSFYSIRRCVAPHVFLRGAAQGIMFDKSFATRYSF